MTALIWASGRGHVGVVNELVNVGAKVDAADKVWNTLRYSDLRPHHQLQKQIITANYSSVNVGFTV